MHDLSGNDSQLSSAGDLSEDENATRNSDSDSGHVSCGQFVRAPIEPKKAGKKRKLEQSNSNHKSKQLYKPPTLEEINRLKETEQYYHSNLFRLQTEEMLKELKVKAKVDLYIETWVKMFRKFLKSLSDVEYERKLTDFNYDGITFPLPATDGPSLLDKEMFKFLSQTILQQVGSTKLRTHYGKPLVVDLVLEIPEKCFRKEDYLNGRYHYKRAHYLCFLADRLKQQTKYPLLENFTFTHLKGDRMKPVLTIVPAEEKFVNKLVFTINAIATEQKFFLTRFLPEKNNVRPAMIGAEVDSSTDLCPTPHYNASILYDLRISSNQHILEDHIQAESIRQAIILLKVWLRQRQFDTGFYGFDGALVTFYIVYLLQTNKIHESQSSYQIIRLFWTYLSSSLWDTEGITMAQVGEDRRASYKQFYEVVFLDNSGLLNLCANLSGDLYRRVKQEAAQAIHLLDNQKINSFESLFLLKYPVYSQYDHLISIHKQKLIKSTVEAFGAAADKMDFFCNMHANFQKLVHQLLRRGLGKRAVLIVPTKIQESSDSAVEFGILLDRHEAFNVIDKGPEAIDKAASDEFRDFWRGKAELRRFNDGSITESCVWGTSADPVGERRLICKKIALFLLNSHLDIPSSKVTYVADQFEVSIRPEEAELHETVEESSLACIRTLDNLSKIIKSLKDLPLAVTGMVGTDPVFRYADPDPPRATAKALLGNGKLMFSSSHYINVTIQLESSGKWPEQLEAIRKLKTAFYMKIANSIGELVGESNAILAQAYNDYLEIFYEKYIFRLVIINQREISLLREYLSENKVTKLYRDTDESIQLEMRATVLPRLTAILHGFHQRYFSFGSVAAMTKRWLYAQLIDPFLWPDECTELIVASIFMKQEPVTQPQTGFLRVLKYLACTDFTKELIVINFNEDLEDEAVDELEKKFAERRDNFPPLAIVTSCDEGKFGLFAKLAPSREILNRVTLLAQHVIASIEEDLNTARKQVHMFYTPSYTGYDLIIYLDSSKVPAIGVTCIKHFTKGEPERAFQYKDPAIGFNPVELYLSELREGYREFALFFHDHCGGDKIAVLWRPDALQQKPFSSTNANGRRLSEEEVLTLNTDALIHDFELLGKGLVQRIERRK